MLFDAFENDIDKGLVSLCFELRVKDHFLNVSVDVELSLYFFKYRRMLTVLR